MLIYIMRHGEAESLAGRDRERKLTPLGASESALVGRWISSFQPQVECILTSPYVRVMQTLAALRCGWPCEKASVETHDFLVPNGHAEKAASYLWDLAYSGISSVLVLSHMPLVSFLVEALDDGKQSPIFCTSGIACIELNTETQQGKLKWIKAPSECR